jgi:hypothetical protein
MNAPVMCVEWKLKNCQRNAKILQKSLDKSFVGGICSIPISMICDNSND